jgi:putative glutamine amidotransferase
MARARSGLQALETIDRIRPRILPATAPLIGIVTHELRAEPAPAWAPGSGRSERDRAPHRLALRLTYTQAVQEAGGVAVVVPAHGFVDDTEALVDRLDGLIFSGGPDLDPDVYDHPRHPQLGPDVDRVSDEYELALQRLAAERDVPVLGICRGMQALNVSRGGTLHQHLPDRSTLEHNQGHASFEHAHPVSVAAGSLLHRLTGASTLEVNSYHHQAVDRLGAGLQVCAVASDSTVEAIWDPSARFCLGVQWHPEVLTHSDRHAPVIQAFVEATRGAPALALAA